MVMNVEMRFNQAKRYSIDDWNRSLLQMTID